MNKDKKSSEEIAEIINTHLEEVYGEKFEVKMMGLIGNSGSPRKVYTADCYPVNNPDLKFEAFYDDGECNDLYMIERWESQGTTYCQEYLNNLYGTDIVMNLRLNASKKVPQTSDFGDLLEKYKDKTTLVMTYFVFYEDNFDKEEQGKLAYKFVNERLKFHEVKSVYMQVNYLEQSKKEEIVTRLNEINDNGVLDSFFIEFITDKSINILRIDSDFDVVNSDNINDFFKY